MFLSTLAQSKPSVRTRIKNDSYLQSHSEKVREMMPVKGKNKMQA